MGDQEADGGTDLGEEVGQDRHGIVLPLPRPP
jgi:hypothetical protein